MFTVNIPALAPPAGAAAQACLQGVVAAGIAVNDPIHNGVLAAASEEFQERLYLLGHSDITPDEVIDSQFRMRAVYVDAVVSRQYQGIQPPNAAVLAPMQQAIGQQFADLGQQIAGLGRMIQAADRRYNRRFNSIEARLQLIDARLQQMEARQQRVEGGMVDLRVDIISMRNRERRAFNGNRQAGVAQLLPQQVLQPLLKSNVREGPGLPGFPPVQPPAVLFGTEFPSPPFSATVGDIRVMTMRQIHWLAVMMNDDFGIVQGDNLRRCREKLETALT